jgi:hypothetical protein
MRFSVVLFGKSYKNAWNPSNPTTHQTVVFMTPTFKENSRHAASM